MTKIILVEPRGLYRLRLRCFDRSEGERDFSELVASFGSLVKARCDPACFARAFTEDGTGLAWPNGLDLDAEALHEAMPGAGKLRQPAA